MNLSNGRHFNSHAVPCSVPSPISCPIIQGAPGPPGPPGLPGQFFAFSTEASTDNLIGVGEVPVLTLGVNPSSPGVHQVKLDSTVELLIETNSANILYSMIYRLRRNDLINPLATMTVERALIGANNPLVLQRQIPNLTWNDTIFASVIYTVTIEVTQSAGTVAVNAQTRALNAIVF